MGQEKTGAVEEYFDKNANDYFREGYLADSTERFYFETRKRIITGFIGDTRGNMLDIGAGPGIMSLPLVDNMNSKLTIVDIAEEMLNLIKRQLVQEDNPYRDNIALISGDILRQEFERNTFDLIICAGILAHLPDIELFIEKVSDWLKYSGKCVVQITNSSNIAGFTQVALVNLRNKYNYRVNHTRRRHIEHLFRKHGLSITARRSYHFRLPLMRRLGPAILQRIEQSIYRLCRHESLAFLGQDYIYLLTKDN